MLDLLLEILERDPASAGQRRHQKQPVGPARDARLVTRDRRRHRDVGHQEVAAIGGSGQRLVHGVARHAVGAARSDHDPGPHDFRPAVDTD